MAVRSFSAIRKGGLSMFSSKKILYFVIISLLLICKINGIDYHTNAYSEKNEQQYEIVDFSDSGFFAVPDGQAPVSIISDQDDEDSGWVFISPDDAPTSTAPPIDWSEPGEGAQSTAPAVPGDVTTQTGTTTAYLPPDITSAPPQTTTSAYHQPDATTTTVPTPAPTQPPTQPPAPQTAAPTTAPTAAPTQAPSYVDSGKVYFASQEISLYVGEVAEVSLIFPLGTQKRAFFDSKNTSIATVKNADDTTARITGEAVGTTWIQATSSSGDFAYCKVTVNDYASEVLALVNAERAAYNLSPLTLGDATLQQVANLRLSEIQTSFSHTRPNGKRFNTAANDIGLRYTYLGENLAMGQTSPEQVMREWMASPSHRDNILNPNYRQLCVAYTVAGNGYYYWVQTFFAA